MASASALPVTDCPLSRREQTQNLVRYGLNVGLVYLAAPILYVGTTQAALCQALGEDVAVANLPSAVYFYLTPLPILVAWLFPAVRHLKRALIGAYGLAAAAGALVAVSLLLPTRVLAVPAILLHAGVLGCTLGTVSTYQWEVLGRGVSASRRGQALSLAFGVMPTLALVGSLISQLVLTGKLGPWRVVVLKFPANFACLYLATVPLMLLGAWIAKGFKVPQPAVDIPREPFVTGVFGGFQQFLSYRLILLASLATVLMGCGYNILPNFTLYTEEAVGQKAEDLVGLQNALRFGFKSVAGLFLGWLLTRTNPKAGLLVTLSFALASVFTVLYAPGMWFMVAFGLMGVGELFGVYYPNYILSCSAPSKMRRNMAFVSMLNMPCGMAAVAYGRIGKHYGLPASFMAAGVVLLTTLAVVQFLLPARPKPRELDKDESDLALERELAAGSRSL